jgi:uncharacterized protein
VSPRLCLSEDEKTGATRPGSDESLLYHSGPPLPLRETVLDRVSRFCGWLVRYRGRLLAVAVLLTVVAWPISRRLAFDQTIESMFAADNPRLQAFLRSKGTFGGDEFLIVAYRDADLFDADDRLTDAAQQRQERLAAQIAAVPGIDPDSLQSLAKAFRFKYGQSRIRQFMEGLLVGEDGETTAVVSRLRPSGSSDTPRSETFRLVRELAAAHDPPAMVVGEPIQVHDMFRYVEQDGATLGQASLLLLMAVIFALFRSVRWMLLPLAVVEATLVWTKAALVLSRMQLSMVSSMLNSLVTIIGIATVMHLTVRFRDARRRMDREPALVEALRGLVVPVFWTVVTTAAGFAALLSSHISPVASFGIMMTLATLLVMLSAGLILPGGVLLGRDTRPLPTAPGEAWVSRGLGRIAEAVQRRPAVVSLAMLGISLFCTLGLFRLHVETDFSKNFRAHSPIVQALNFFETNLGGAGTWEVNFPAPPQLTDEYVDQVRALADELSVLAERNTPDRLTKVVVLTDGLDLIPTNLIFTRLSLDTRFNFLNAMQPEFAAGLYNPDAGRMRIILRALERQPSEAKLKLIADVETIARKHFPEAEATGLFVLLAFLIESLLSDQLVSSLLAAGMMVVLMSLAQRSVPIGLSLLLPNVFPIVLVIGTMGWLGLKVNIATAMIASVSMGLTIDSSIHYLAGYRRARASGLSVAESLHATHQEVGLAFVWANVALVAGFSVLTLSHFIPLVYFGVLVSAAMIGGLIGNLILLPLLLRFFAPWEPPQNVEALPPQ